MFDKKLSDMRLTILAIAASLSLFACNNSSNSQRPSSKYEEKKASLEEMEKESPLKFLKISGSHRRNLVSKEVVEGEVVNKATLTAYKNIKVQITFLDKDGGTIEKQKHTLDDDIKPGSTIDFKIKVGHVDEASSVSLDIVDAVADK